MLRYNPRMQIKKTAILGVYALVLEPIEDERGYFMRTFGREALLEHGIDFEIVQANQSLTKQKGSIRGMHFQQEPKQEDKLVQCVNGAIYDVALDLRPDSPTYRQWHGEELSDKNHTMLLVPKGCAHGFQTLTDNCLMQYYISESYAPDLSSGVRWDDPAFNITWPLGATVLSEKDQSWPLQ